MWTFQSMDKETEKGDHKNKKSDGANSSANRCPVSSGVGHSSSGYRRAPHPLAPLSNVELQIICENLLRFMRAVTQEVRILALEFSAMYQIIVVFTPNRSRRITAAFFAPLFATAFLSIMIANVVSSLFSRFSNILIFVSNTKGIPNHT